jgi:peptide/nickel transport system permease protein
MSTDLGVMPNMKVNDVADRETQPIGGSTYETASTAMARHRSRNSTLLWQLRKQPLAVGGVIIVLVLVVSSLLAPWVAPYDPLYIDMKATFQSPSPNNLMGTDELGRDVFSRVLYGTRLSVAIAAFVLLISVPIGIAVGTISGYYGGRVDNLLMRLTDIFLSFPGLVLAIAIAAALGPGLGNAMLAIALVWWPWYARLVRGQVLQVKENLYVDAALSIGASTPRIMLRHVLPNCIGPIVVLTTLDVGLVILVAAGLSFIGLGARPPTPELGTMISQGRSYMLDFPWIPTFPGLAIFVLALGMNLIGDGMRDILDPTMD